MDTKEQGLNLLNTFRNIHKVNDVDLLSVIFETVSDIERNELIDSIFGLSYIYLDSTPTASPIGEFRYSSL